jgi:hypothetical protein
MPAPALPERHVPGLLQREWVLQVRNRSLRLWHWRRDVHRLRDGVEMLQRGVQAGVLHQCRLRGGEDL